MKKEALKRIFDFLEEKESKKYKDTLRWKLIFNEPLTKEDLNVKGDLDLSGRNITSLPEGLKVGGNLHLQVSKIELLPKGLKVGGALDVSYTPKLKSLPSDLDVKGNMHLGGTKIISLPEGLKVGGTIFVYEANLSSLPKGLKVGGDLYIREVDLEKYSDKELREMVKPGFIKGKIDRD